MLPVNSGGSLDDLYYPMTADVYYSTQVQNDFGEIQRTWQKDREIQCSAIKDKPNSNVGQAFNTEKFSEYDIRVALRTKDNLYASESGTLYRPTEILITNIKDPSGNVVWKESQLEPTEFEVENIEPLYNEYHNLSGYRVLLCRSNLQVGV